MKNLFEEPYIEVIRFPADVFTTMNQSPDTAFDAGESGSGEELDDQ